MNKSLFIYFLVFLLSLNLANAQYDLIEITPKDSLVSPGEVYQARLILKNPVTELKKQHLRLYSSSGIVQPISPFLLDLEKNNYFIYFEIPSSTLEGDYTLMIESQSFLVNNILIQEEGEQKITIKISQPSVSITPGAIQLEKDSIGSFIVTANSKYMKTEINFDVPDYITHSYTVQQYLNKNSPRKFAFYYGTKKTQPAEIIFSYGNKTFNVPIFIKGYNENQNASSQPQQGGNTSINEDAISFLVEGGKLSKEIKSTETIEGNLNMANILDKPLFDLKISLESPLDEVISITPISIEKVEPHANFSVFMSINSDKSPSKKFYSGKLTVSNQEHAKSLDVEIKISQKETEEALQVGDSDIYLEGDDAESEDENQEKISQIIPWNISGGYEKESQIAAKPIVTLITILLIIAILIFILSQKKTSKKKTFAQLMQESGRK